MRFLRFLRRAVALSALLLSLVGCSTSTRARDGGPAPDGDPPGGEPADAGPPDAGDDADDDDADDDDDHVDDRPPGGRCPGGTGVDEPSGCHLDPCPSDERALHVCSGTPASARACLIVDTSTILDVAGIGTRTEPLRSSSDTARDLPPGELPAGAPATFDGRPGVCVTRGRPGKDGCSTAADCYVSGKDCGFRCVRGFFGDTDTACLEACGGGGGNGGCRDGDACRRDIGGGACFPGCRLDLECRVAREDTNGNGVLDPVDEDTNPDGDRLVWDRDSAAWCDDGGNGFGCNPTFTCVNPGDPDAVVGDPCRRSSECPWGGTCAIEAVPADSSARSFPGGACVGPRCVEDGACGPGGICQTKGFGEAVCLPACSFAAELGTPAELGVDGRGMGCRPGYRCAWHGTLDRDGTLRTDGACLPGTYNAVTSPNVGHPCDRNDDCYSPLGAGRCRRFMVAGTDPDMPPAPRGYCVIEDCHPGVRDLEAVLPDGVPATAARALPPGIPDSEDFCGPGTMCLPVGGDVIDGSPPAETECFPTCAGASDCAAGFACNDTLLPRADGLCWIDCIDRTDPNGDGVTDLADGDPGLCRPGETCSPDTGTCIPEDRR